MKVLAVIPARGGSKGIPRKNVRLMAGKPLIAYPSVTPMNHDNDQHGKIVLSL